jgi:hypothetical protein
MSALITRFLTSQWLYYGTAAEAYTSSPCIKPRLNDEDKFLALLESCFTRWLDALLLDAWDIWPRFVRLIDR